jgi:hypothetical protein
MREARKRSTSAITPFLAIPIGAAHTGPTNPFQSEKGRKAEHQQTEGGNQGGKAGKARTHHQMPGVNFGNDRIRPQVRTQTGHHAVGLHYLRPAISPMAMPRRNAEAITAKGWAATIA